MLDAAPVDVDARVRAVAHEGSVLVQAPAGSGKTTLLTQRFLRLLAAVDAPERILALTFTRLAANEMRERVLHALRAARGPQPPSMNDLTWELACRAQRHLQSLQLDLEAQPARLRIETIDAFNGWLAHQLPIASGTGAPLRVTADARPLHEEAARRALSHHGEDVFGMAVERTLALDDQRWRRLVKLIAAMLSSRERWLPLLAGRLRAAHALAGRDLAAVRMRFDDDLTLLITRTLQQAYDVLGGECLERLAALMPHAARRLGADGAHLRAWLADSSVLRPQAAQVERWRGIAHAFLTKSGAVRKTFRKTDGFPPACAEKAAMLDLALQFGADDGTRDMLLKLRGLPAGAYGDGQWQRVRDVAQVMVLAAAQLEAVFREHGVVDFTAVSLAARRALGEEGAPTDLALRLDYRLQHVLVDEFQDTSSAQLELLRLLSAGWQPGDGHSLFCVGDPMQSIYGFRQAEVRAFLELADEGIGAVRFDVQRLQTNFRAAQPLVDWVNRCFSQLLPRVDDRDRGAIAFRASVAAPRAAAAGLGSPACVALLGFDGRQAESDAVAQLVAEQLAAHPQWRIAILVRAKSHARELAASLRSRAVPFRGVEMEPLQDQGVVRDIIALTSALLHWADRTAWLAVLRAPWTGLTLDDLLSIARGAALVWDALYEPAVLSRLSADGQARCARLRSVLEAAFAIRGDSSIARWIERTWIALGGPACVRDNEELRCAEAAFRRLNELEAGGLPDPAELKEKFAELYANMGSQSAVELMTIHKAKGLEFDMVVLPCLDRTVRQNQDELLLTHQFSRVARDGMVMAARPPVGTDSEPLFEFLRAELQEAASLEARRLLYVACTRAKTMLRLTAVCQAPPRTGSLLAALWPAVAAEFVMPSGSSAISTFAAAGRAAANDAQLAPRGGALRRLPTHWSPPPAPGGLPPATAAAALPDETPIFDWVGETARRVGHLVHAELQAMVPERSSAVSIRARRAHFTRWLELHGVPPDRLQSAASRVVDCLLRVQEDARGRWILGSYGEDRREYALSGICEGQLIHAVFDRSFVEDGVRWVIDYKTSQHQGGAREEFLDTEVQRYQLQMQRYGKLARCMGAEPVRLALYFPLMQAWREWSAAD